MQKPNLIEFGYAEYPTVFDAQISVEAWAERVAHACEQEVALPTEYKYDIWLEEKEVANWVSKKFFDSQDLRVEVTSSSSINNDFDNDIQILIFVPKHEGYIHYAHKSIIGLELPSYLGSSRMFEAGNAADTGITDYAISWRLTHQDGSDVGDWAERYTAAYSDNPSDKLDEHVKEYLGFTNDGDGLKVVIYHEGKSVVYNAYPYL